MKRVNRSSLTDPIDAANALLEAHRVPRQFEVNHEPAMMVKVEPFRRGIGGEQQSARIARERTQHRRSFVTAQPAVEQ